MGKSITAIVSKILIYFLVTITLTGTCGVMAACEKTFRQPTLIEDTLQKEQLDSLLFELNLEYLNGLNEHRTPYELIPIIEYILDIDPTRYNYWFNLGIENMKIHEYHKAINAFERGLELHPKQGNPTLVQIYISISYCYHQVDRHYQERKILNLASSIDHDNPTIYGRYAVCAYSRLRYKKARFYQDKVVSILQARDTPEAEIAFNLGKIYLNTDYTEAEKHLRRACQIDPGDPEKLGMLAWVLIMSTLKIDEGMELLEKAIAADPENPVFIHQQGYGFYLKDRYEDALQNLYHAKRLYRDYNYELEKHIELVEEAISRQHNRDLNNQTTLNQPNQTLQQDIHA